MRRYRWIIRGAILALLLALGVAAALGEEESPYVENEWNYVDGSMDVSGGIPADAEGVLADIRDAGVLRVATEPYFPPQEFIDPTLTGQERYVGSDMSLARVLARRMGVDLVIMPMEFTEVLNAVRDGYCDLAISALSYTPGRAAIVELSKGYFYAEESQGSALLIRSADTEAIKGVEDLKDRDIVAQGGSLQEMLMAESVQDYHEFRRLPSMQEVPRVPPPALDAGGLRRRDQRRGGRRHGGCVLRPVLRRKQPGGRFDAGAGRALHAGGAVRRRPRGGQEG